MENLEVCPILLYKFEAEENLVQEVLCEVQKISYDENKYNLISTDLYFNSELLLWFDKCIDQVRSKQYPSVEKLVVTSCWVNKTVKLHQHHEHIHPNSLISGIFYLTSHDSGETIFLNKDKWQDFDNSFMSFLDSSPTKCLSKIKPKAGTLILFPSNLRHRTAVLKKTEEIRFSISFNTFITGRIDVEKEKIGIGNRTINQINLNTEDYRVKILSLEKNKNE